MHACCCGCRIANRGQQAGAGTTMHGRHARAYAKQGHMHGCTCTHATHELQQHACGSAGDTHVHAWNVHNTRTCACARYASAANAKLITTIRIRSPHAHSRASMHKQDTRLRPHSHVRTYSHYMRQPARVMRVWARPCTLPCHACTCVLARQRTHTGGQVVPRSTWHGVWEARGMHAQHMHNTCTTREERKAKGTHKCLAHKMCDVHGGICVRQGPWNSVS